MALKEISYEEYMRKLDASEKWYRSDEDFPPGARETGLRICEKFRREVEELGPENLIFLIDTVYDMPLYKLKEPKE